MPVDSPTIAQRPRVSVKVNSAAFDWFNHICRWFSTLSHRSLHNKPEASTALGMPRASSITR